MTAPAARIEALEAEAFRTQRFQQHVDERLSYIVGALGDLSQDARGTALAVRELDAKIDQVRDELRDEMRQGFAAVLAALGGNRPTGQVGE